MGVIFLKGFHLLKYFLIPKCSICKPKGRKQGAVRGAVLERLILVFVRAKP